MAVYESKLIVGGFFTQIGILPVRNIAKWNGSNWESFSILNNAVYSMLVHNSDLFCGGSFTVASSITANYIAVYKIKLIGINQVSSEIPGAFYLAQNYPNPFNPSTNIRFSITEKQYVEIEVFDITGRSAGKLLNKELNAGTYEMKWDASRLTSGVYFYRMLADKFTVTKKMILIK